MSETAWKVAMEAAAREAAEHSSTHEDAPWTENDAAVARVRSLPMHPAFSAAVEAETGELRKMLHEAAGLLVETDIRCADIGLSERSDIRLRLRALLSRMEGKS